MNTGPDGFPVSLQRKQAGEECMVMWLLDYRCYLFL